MSRHHGHGQHHGNGQSGSATPMTAATVESTPAPAMDVAAPKTKAKTMPSKRSVVAEIETKAEAVVEEVREEAQGLLANIAKRVVERPFRTVGLAVLAGAFLGYESPRRSLVLTGLKALVLAELKSFADGLPSQYSELLSHPLRAAANALGNAPARPTADLGSVLGDSNARLA